ncbi:DEAD/DEAH box helicase [Sulfuriroseicoccus oceanibius]|uniref:DEAD/DEAH box helicase n=2 Tax=Sulfuriroseicoccus oceanibius TaxID=2707525 RepID=A0A6B3LDN3_9BACT|nr:DEAD/DEAH box helicase [Sulfuriroseicoccus oceanibius]
MGYVSPTEIQAKSIPIVLAGKDIIGASQTGTGKTAAFMLPIIDKLKSHGKLRCLVLEPTRELAAQVEDAIVNFGKFTDIRELVVHGGVGYGKQNEFLKRGVDIVVATPGRLLDHMNSGTISLDEIDYLVLDEVDRMLDMGFLPDVRRIVEKCSKDRQTLFFSATMPPQIESLASFALKEPEKVEVGRRFSPADTVAHAFYPVADEQRNELILAMLKKTDFHSVMIFTRTKAEADRIFDMIERDGNHKATVMHSDIRQSQRTQALQGFREGKFEIIVATDVAARGIDVSDVSHVINYRVPENPEDYVHRIGRTGRANKTGDAFTLLSGDELEYAEAVERFIGSKVERKKLEDFNYLYTAMLDDDVPSDPDALKKALGRNRRRGGGGRRRRR